MLQDRFSIPDVDDVFGALRLQAPLANDALRVSDGWCRTLASGLGFRHDYDREVACGGWEFHRFGRGLCLAVTDMVASRNTPRRHSLADQLVLSAVVEGDIPISNAAAGSRLANGYCTMYALGEGEELHTIYEQGRTLKWVSLFIDRRSLFEAIGLKPEDLPVALNAFVREGGALPQRNLRLSPDASLAAMQMLECPFRDGFRHTFLLAKSIELACHMLCLLASELSPEELQGVCLSEEDHRRVRRAMQLIERHIECPPNTDELAAAVDLTRHKLQLGFRLVYGDTAGRVRDRVRMQHALTLVRESTLPLTEVALHCGYEHAASFTRAFKATYGVAPARMRRMAQESVMLGKLHKR